MKLKVLLGVACGGVFLYLALRNVDFEATGRALAGVRYDYLGLAACVLILAHVIRAHRWGVLLSSLQKIPFARLFEVTCVGFLMINILPARLGEFTRPYLLARKEGVAMGVSVATIVIERVLDILALLLLLGWVSLCVALPDWLLVSAWSFLGFAVAALTGLILLMWKRDTWGKSLENLIQKKQTKAWHLVAKGYTSFVVGLGTSFHLPSFLMAGVLSLLLWMFSSVAIYLALLAMDIRLPLHAALTVQVVLCLGIMLPSAPAFIGTFQFFIMTSLTLFGVSKDLAFSYAVLFHGLGLAVVIGLGLLYVPTVLLASAPATAAEKDLSVMPIGVD